MQGICNTSYAYSLFTSSPPKYDKRAPATDTIVKTNVSAPGYFFPHAGLIKNLADTLKLRPSGPTPYSGLINS